MAGGGGRGLAPSQGFERVPGAASRPLAPTYYHRQPERTVLHQVLREHLDGFLRQTRGVPGFARAELERYLGCGILAHGFARVRCSGCGFERLVAFSCKGRGVCPSCGARRMAETAALLCEQVLPRVPYRQWVLTVPHRVRYLLARRPELITLVLGCFLRVVQGRLKRAAARLGERRSQSGAVTAVQRFGDSLNLHVHAHALMPDGVWVERGDRVEFLAVPPPTDEEVRRVCATTARRVVRLLRRRGLLEGEEDEGPADLLGSLQAKAILAALALHQPGAEFPQKDRCASVEGFSVHANVAIHANDRDGLERLCRYGARPSLSLERMRRLADGRVGYRLKRLIGETSEIVLDPTEFIARLVTLVPPPRAHLTRYHGVFAPHARLRPKVVLLPAPAKDAPSSVPRPRSRLDWAGLLRRTYAVDVLQCARCPGRMTVLAYLTDRAVVRRILEHLGLPADPPPRGPAPAGRVIVDVFEAEATHVSHLPAWMRSAAPEAWPEPGEGRQTEAELGLVDVEHLPGWMRQPHPRSPEAVGRPVPAWDEVVDAPIDLSLLPAWMWPRQPPVMGPPEPWAELASGFDEEVDVSQLPAWMRQPPPRGSEAKGPGADRPVWDEAVDAPVDVSALPAWMQQPAPRPPEREPGAGHGDAPTWDEHVEAPVDVSALPAWMRPGPRSVRAREEVETFDAPAMEVVAEAEVAFEHLPAWMRGAPAKEGIVARSYNDGESVVDLARLPEWMHQGYVPIAPILNPRSRPAPRGEWQPEPIAEPVRSRAWPRPSRRLDEPQVDRQSLAELPDETPDPLLLPSWIGRTQTRIGSSASRSCGGRAG